MWNNGQGWQAYGDLNLRTWYQSDLVTITDQAMTKHYFIAGAALSLSKRQRIASKLAESLAPEVAHALKDKSLTPLSSDLKELGANMAERIKRDFNCVGLDYNAFYPGEPHLKALENLLNAPEQPDEYQVFFYHSDHLGSSSFITDINGDATQHLQYLPFGEDFVHQQNTAAYYTPYTFSGKERDVETDLSYFGARYYEAGLSVWLSVDPMADYAPNWTPYRYGFYNPVNYIDPDGMFETRREARQHRREHKVDGRIIKNSDGTFSIDSKNSSTYKGADGRVVTAGVVRPKEEAKIKYSNIDVILPATIHFAINFEAVAAALSRVGALSLLTLSGDSQQGIVLNMADGRTAGEIIANERKGSINKEFPDEWRDKTLNEIERAARAGNKVARKALKLLRDGRFRK